MALAVKNVKSARKNGKNDSTGRRSTKTPPRLARATGSDLRMGDNVKSLTKTISKTKSTPSRTAKTPKVATKAQAPKAKRNSTAAATKKTVKTAAPPKSKTVKAKRGTVRATAQVTPTSIAADIMAEAMMADVLANEDALVEAAAAREERMRDVLARLSVASNRYDEMPNLELAADIVFHDDREAVNLLITALERGDDVHAPDAGRVLAEIANRASRLVETEVPRLVALVSPENLAVLPAVLTALAPLGTRIVDEMWECRELFWQLVSDGQTEASEAQAAAVKLLACMCAAGPDYARTLAGGLVDLLGKCLAKDVALYAEAVLPALGTAHSHRAKPVLDRRLKELSPAEVARLRRAVRMAQTGQAYSAAA